MKYERLTTDKPQNNKDFLLNFAFVKDGEVYLRGMGDDGEEIRLCDYIAIRVTSEKGCERTPKDILDGACNECHCELAALNIVAIQAAELRHRLAELEDKIESGELSFNDNLYKTAFELILQDVYETCLQADVLSCSSCPFMEEIFDECQNQGLYEDCKRQWQKYYLEQSEARLKELRNK